MPKQLRQMFAYICIFQRPYDTNVLWETFKDAMSEDFIQVSNATIAYAKTLSDISLTLKLHGQTLKSIGLPEYDAAIKDSESNQQDTLPLSIQHDLIDSANQEQRDIISTIMKCVSLENTSVPNAYFIDGPGGTGKTFVYKCLINSRIEMGYDVIPVAWTGIAAMLLPGGRTVHSRFRLPLILTDTSVSSLKVNSKKASTIRKSKLIIWDEAPMESAFIVLGGDFRQVLPVVPYGSRQLTIQNCIKNSPIWPHFKILKLFRNMRLNQNEIEFSKFLLQIVNDEYPLINPESDEYSIEIKPSLLSKNIIKDVFGNIIFNLENVSIFSQFAILTPKNEHCDEINNSIVNMLPGPEKTYLSLNTVSKDCDDFLFPTEFLDSLHLSGLPPHSLILKKGTIVILLRNLNVTSNPMNGTRFIVRNMYDHSLDLESITGQGTGQRILLPRIDLTPSDSTVPFSFARRQFPIRIAFAMTINKAQGQTLDKVGLYLPRARSIRKPGGRSAAGTTPVAGQSERRKPATAKALKAASYRRNVSDWRKNPSIVADRVLTGVDSRAEMPRASEMFKYWVPIVEGNIMENSQPQSPVSSQDNDSSVTVLESITPEEIEASLPSAKTAPGPDGFPARLWRRIPCNLIAGLFNMFNATSSLPIQLVRSRTIFVVKKGDPKCPGNYRPISIASIAIRHYHRVLAKRLEKLSVVDSRQCAFRCADGVAENLFLLDSVLKDARSSAKGLCLASLDLSKAFDSVSHASITSAMRGVGLDPRFVEYIRATYQSSETVIQVADKARGAPTTMWR
ncbi:hypothetical protein QTP88_021169 [Uroleucon formosanum]